MYCFGYFIALKRVGHIVHIAGKYKFYDSKVLQSIMNKHCVNSGITLISLTLVNLGQVRFTINYYASNLITTAIASVLKVDRKDLHISTYGLFELI